MYLSNSVFIRVHAQGLKYRLALDYLLLLPPKISHQCQLRNEESTMNYSPSPRYTTPGTTVTSLVEAEITSSPATPVLHIPSPTNLPLTE